VVVGYRGSHKLLVLTLPAFFATRRTQLYQAAHTAARLVLSRMYALIEAYQASPGQPLTTTARLGYVSTDTIELLQQVGSKHTQSTHESS